ncbi:MAG: DUF6146 family protein [Bacteroidota bacterium]
MKIRKYDNRKAIIYFGIMIFAFFILSSCNSSKKKVENTEVHYSTLELKPVEPDSDNETEYDIIITDIGYDTFLLNQKPKNFYSQQYYENWNKYYVTDWNQKVQTASYHSQKYQNVFDMYIDYNPSINYGLDVNYKLYYYFMFVEKKYGIHFNVPRAINY